MAYTKDSLLRLFQSKFNLSKWQMMMKDYFRADKVRIQPEALAHIAASGYVTS